MSVVELERLRNRVKELEENVIASSIQVEKLKTEANELKRSIKKV